MENGSFVACRPAMRIGPSAVAGCNSVRTTPSTPVQKRPALLGLDVPSCFPDSVFQIMYGCGDLPCGKGCPELLVGPGRGTAARLWAGQQGICGHYRFGLVVGVGNIVGAVHRRAQARRFPQGPGVGHQSCSVGLRREGPSISRVLQRWRMRESRALVRCSFPRNFCHLS